MVVNLDALVRQLRYLRVPPVNPLSHPLKELQAVVVSPRTELAVLVMEEPPAVIGPKEDAAACTAIVEILRLTVGRVASLGPIRIHA
jgi:hypothetical protein